MVKYEIGRGMSNSQRRLAGARQRPVCVVDNFLISHQDNQIRYLRAYEPPANAHGFRITSNLEKSLQDSTGKNKSCLQAFAAL